MARRSSLAGFHTASSLIWSSVSSLASTCRNVSSDATPTIANAAASLFRKLMVVAPCMPLRRPCVWPQQLKTPLRDLGALKHQLGAYTIILRLNACGRTRFTFLSHERFGSRTCSSLAPAEMLVRRGHVLIPLHSAFPSLSLKAAFRLQFFTIPMFKILPDCLRIPTCNARSLKDVARRLAAFTLVKIKGMSLFLL